ncbi:MAG: hypothetical protein DWQ56_11350 [Microcystis aeruginosa DA14]|uniref:Uncharacterized protein n=1 Tax=Microcystis aeruginosa DA14 TaxID=1987506 RepID=A0A3E0MDK6_MICAE|nr:MAG: hypothetical protein DWQ56_11350 [Microcystis aeruginosa DA14]
MDHLRVADRGDRIEAEHGDGLGRRPAGGGVERQGDGVDAEGDTQNMGRRGGAAAAALGQIDELVAQDNAAAAGDLRDVEIAQRRLGVASAGDHGRIAVKRCETPGQGGGTDADRDDAAKASERGVNPRHSRSSAARR